MYGCKNIYESYYEHHCTAATEKDVIDLDIWGNGVVPRLKRWWHDLFLLSYTDSRSKHYYMSSYAMMMARSAQFRYHRGSIHPFSKFRNFWDFLILCAILIHVILFHFNGSIISEPYAFSYYLVAVIEYIIILDLFINAKTGYIIIRTRAVVIKSPDILINYLSTNAFIHALCAIPLQNLMILRLGNEMTDPIAKTNNFVSTLKIISVFRIVKVFQVSEYWAKDRGTFRRTTTFKFVRIIVVGLVALIQVDSLISSMSVISYILNDMPRIPDSHLGILIYHKYSYNMTNEPLIFLMKVSRTAKSLFLFGYGLWPNVEWTDQVHAVLSYVIAILLHYWASILLYDCMVRGNSLDDCVAIARDQTLRVLRIQRLPDVMHAKVNKYYDLRMSSPVMIERWNNLFKALPPDLKAEIKTVCYRGLVVRIPCFSEWPPDVISGIADLLKSEIYLDGDLVSSGSQPEGLVVVEAGLLAEYSSRARETRHLEDGDHFGAPALVTDRDAPAGTVVAITPSVVLILDKLCFRNMMRAYPDLFNQLKRKISSSGDSGLPNANAD